ncbi:Uncharacterised protein [Metamycoplasma arthritidis]|uniref:Hypothetical membrane protein n=1 Tax=Metamycoplasma arthritidis (strain 158L3-1) TaxID=243272 RepID=B3PMD9_META1|nr:hypothetical protein [Metamycoplasma arthritidis]ACF07191.1 hypothetical membrane protein [Metamycoplasma arthritidis 158L3-1]VEU78715.1 Uncharacterised protein [Metamycoplasma arthritidis]
MKKTSRVKTVSRALIWSIVGLGIIGSVSGAIYFVIKNSKPQSKDYYSPEQFQKEAQNVSLKANLETSQDAQTILSSFLKGKAEVLIYSALRDTQEKSNSEFDPHKFISRHITNSFTFQQVKNFTIEYTNLRPVKDSSYKLIVEYTIKLNYNNASGRHESEKIKGTNQSLYYYHGEKTVDFLNQESDLENNILFKENIQKGLPDLLKILRRHLEKDSSKENVREDSQEANNDAEKWFNSEEFRAAVFKWFKEIFEKSDAYPLAFREKNQINGAKKFDLVSYKENDNPYVQWNPKKGLNVLTIDYQFQSLSDPNIKSTPFKWIYNVDGI